MKPFLITLISLIFISCSSKIPSMEERTNSALDFAIKNSLNKVIINSSNFNIFSLQSNTNSCENQTLNIYIEGDGLSWISKKSNFRQSNTNKPNFIKSFKFR